MDRISTVKISERANKKAQKEFKKDVKSKIRDLKYAVKIAAKKGDRMYQFKIRRPEIEAEALKYFRQKGFNAFKQNYSDMLYYKITW